MALQNQPMFQQEMLRQHSKSSMRGQRTNRVQSRGIQTRLHEMDLARKSAFANIGLSKKRSDLQHRGRMAAHKIAKGELADRQRQLPWTIGIGAGTALLSGLEGKRRADMIREQVAKNERRYQDTRRDAHTNEAYMRSRMFAIPGMGIYE